MTTTLRMYDALRANATNVTRETGSNVDKFMQGGQEIVLCHLSAITSFTTGDSIPRETIFEDGASYILAVEHLNTGDGSIVPQVQGLNQRCPIRFTTEFADDQYSGGIALGHVVEQTSRTRNSAKPLPCAFLGAARSSITIPMSIVTGLLGYPQVSSSATSSSLDDKSQYPLFGRTVPSDAGTAIPIIQFLNDIVHVKHLAVINVNDAYGNAYVDGLRAAAATYAPDMVIYQAPLDDTNSSIPIAIKSIKGTGYRFIFGILFTTATHDALLSEAYRQGVAGDGLHTWFFGDTFAGILDGRTFEKNSPLALAYSGAGLLEASGGIPTLPDYDKYVTSMNRLKNPTDLAYMGSLLPMYNSSNYLTASGTAPYIYNTTFLAPLASDFAPLAYEAAIALGLSACDAYGSNKNKTLVGTEHFDYFKNLTFKGVVNNVVFDPLTGTRLPSSLSYKVANFIGQESVDASTGLTMINFAPVVASFYQGGTWKELQKYVYNDGTTNQPLDLPPPVDSYHLNLALVIGLTLGGLVVLAVTVFLFYENKRKQNDSIWKIDKSEIKFSDPPEVVGSGAFGLVLLGEYRGTQVAVKRVLPQKGKGGMDISHNTGSVSGDNEHSGHSGSNSMNDRSKFAMQSSGMKSASHGTQSTMLSTIGRTSTASPGRMETGRRLKKDFLEEMRSLSKLRHPCITTIMGAVVGKCSKVNCRSRQWGDFDLPLSLFFDIQGEDPMLVMEYMEHGSLNDCLKNETLYLEGELLIKILSNISQGLR
jgi:hypothetical protein